MGTPFLDVLYRELAEEPINGLDDHLGICAPSRGQLSHAALKGFEAGTNEMSRYHGKGVDS